MLGQQLRVGLTSGQLEHPREHRESRGAVDAVRTRLEEQILPRSQLDHARWRLRPHLVERLGDAGWNASGVTQQVAYRDLVTSGKLRKELRELVRQRKTLQLEQASQNHGGHRLVDRAGAELRSWRIRYTVLTVSQTERPLVHHFARTSDQKGTGEMFGLKIRLQVAFDLLFEGERRLLRLRFTRCHG
jgi:hypothetical protein